MKSEGTRKVRSDKKRPIAAPISLEIRESIANLSYLCEIPMKVVGECLCLQGYESDLMMDVLQKNFRRNLDYKNQRYIIGRLENPKYDLDNVGCTQRLSMRFMAKDYERLAALAYAMDLSVQAAAAALITVTIKRNDIMLPIMANSIRRNLEPEIQEKIRQLTRYLDAKSPNDYITMPMVIAYGIEKAIQDQTKVRHIFESWMREVKI
jgi:hypothetical protein